MILSEYCIYLQERKCKFGWKKKTFTALDMQENVQEINGQKSYV
jgi:hypothetical protein